MNDSISAISPAWPTRWPKNSFTSPWTWVIAGVIAVPLIFIFWAGLTHPLAQNPSSTMIDQGLALQFFIDGLLIALILPTLKSLSQFSLRDLGFQTPRPEVIGIALVGTVAMVVVANGSAILIERLLHAHHVQSDVTFFRQLHDPLSITFFIVFAVVFAPFAEETCFRVFFFNLGMRYGGFWAGAILSGILFGIAHGDPYSGLSLALGGVVLCGVYYRSRNAFAPMLTHALFNGLSIVLLLAVPSIS